MAESEIKVSQELIEKRVQITRENVKLEVAGAVSSVNGQTGDVVLNAEDVGALPDTTTIPTSTSDLNNDSDFQTGQQVADAIATEATARENADNGLQGQIDALSAASDVTDIVGTYAALQAYDTSTLGDNDIIKVLQDEQHSDETTYYRWSTTTQTFTLIGEEGPYYTKSAADAKFQDKLTAGANININANNEISATDTTYSDFTGTDGQTAGAAGLVPAPATTDADKFLKSDGTWDTAGGGGPTVVQTTGTSTTDVMSQDATTKMIFPKYGVTSPSNGAVVIGKNADAQSSDTASTAYPSVVIGQGAKGGSTFSNQGDTGAVVIGAEAEARGYTDYYGIAIGYAAGSAGGHIAIGHRAATHTANSSKFNIAIGEETRQNTGDNQQHNGMVALGAYAKNSRSNEVSVGNPSNATYTTRYLANVTDPSLPQDSATKNYVDTQVGNIETILQTLNSGTGASS